jgi:Derlin-2/3
MLGGLSPSFVFRLLWTVQYGGPLERTAYQFDPAGYLYMLMVCGAALLAASPVFNMYFMGSALVMSIIYVWSRNFTDGNVSLYGVIQIRSFYLPFAFAAITLLLGQPLLPDLVGIGAGHMYYFLKDIYPRQSGHDVLATPEWLRRWLADAGIRGAVPPAAQAAGAPQGFQAFRGSGRRLGGS